MTTNIETLDGEASFDAHVARPASAARAAVIVLQEIFGVNCGIRAKCNHWASLGYLALAPDLFWRVERGVDLDPDVPADFQRGLALMKRFDVDTAIGDIEATIRHARREGAAKVGVVGYCLGGRLAFLTATRTDVDAAIGYYGVGLDQLVGERHGIARPLLLHVAGADHFVPAAAQAAIHAALDGHPGVTIHDYPGVDHGFAVEAGLRRSDDAARLADERSDAFFAAHL